MSGAITARSTKKRKIQTVRRQIAFHCKAACLLGLKNTVGTNIPWSDNLTVTVNQNVTVAYLSVKKGTNDWIGSETQVNFTSKLPQGHYGDSGSCACHWWHSSGSDFQQTGDSVERYRTWSIEEARRIRGNADRGSLFC